MSNGTEATVQKFGQKVNTKTGQVFSPVPIGPPKKAALKDISLKEFYRGDKSVPMGHERRKFYEKSFEPTKTNRKRRAFSLGTQTPNDASWKTGLREAGERMWEKMTPAEREAARGLIQRYGSK